MRFPVQQEIYTTSFCYKYTYKAISCVAESNAVLMDLDPHYIGLIDVPGIISESFP